MRRHLPKPAAWLVAIALLLAGHLQPAETLLLVGFGLLCVLLNRILGHPDLTPERYERLMVARVKQALAGYRTPQAISLIEGGGIVLLSWIFPSVPLAIAALGAIACLLLLWSQDWLRPILRIPDHLGSPGDRYRAKVMSFFGNPAIGFILGLLTLLAVSFTFLREILPILGTGAKAPPEVALGFASIVIFPVAIAALLFAGTERMKLALCTFVLAALSLLLAPLLASFWIGSRLDLEWLSKDSSWDLMIPATVFALALARELAPAFSLGQRRAEPPACHATALIALLAIAPLVAWSFGSLGFHIVAGMLAIPLGVSVVIFLSLGTAPGKSPSRWTLAAAMIGSGSYFSSALVGLQGIHGLVIASGLMFLLLFVAPWVNIIESSKD